MVGLEEGKPRPPHRAAASSPAALLAVSTGTTALAVERPFWDLEAALAGAAGTGFPALEIVLLAEWADRPPRSPCPNAPVAVVRPARDTIADRVLAVAAHQRIAVIHANRDVGALWAAGEQGAALSELLFAVELGRAAGAGHVVLHAWDPDAARVDRPGVLALLLLAAPTGSPAPVLAVENVPSQDGRPEDLLRDIWAACPWAGLTLDLNWASLYGNLDRLLAGGRERLAGVHVHGRWEGTRLVPRHGHLDLEAAIRHLAGEGFRGPYTLELAGPRGGEDFAAARRWLEGVLR